jgi:hypothetical protein
MFGTTILCSRAVALAFVLMLLAGASCAATARMGGQQQDKRKLTTIQSAKAGGVEVRYLNLPWGEATFGYMEVGGSEYYSNRTWPFAHLTLAAPATWQGHALAAGDYVFYVTPKSAKGPMTLTLASFKPNQSGTFLTAGDVFTETPTDAVPVATIPVTFDKKDPIVDHLEIDVAEAGDGQDIVVHYGNRWLTEHVSGK